MTTITTGARLRRSWWRRLAPVAAALVLAGCAAARPGVVKRPPPLPAKRVEIAPVAPSRAHVWVPGQWAWHRDRYVWVPGHWEVPAAPGHIWVPGGWAVRDEGYVWVEGHWRAR
jgi:WXXGXW repeat (2 copies)